MTDNVQVGKEGTRRVWSRSVWAALVCLIILTGALYGPTAARATFIGDDWFHVGRVPLERIPRLFFGDWHLGYQGFGGFYRPLPRLVMQFGRLCFDLWAPGYLLFSATLHVFNCLLIWLVAMRLTDRPTVAWSSALIFAAYPTHPEALVQTSTLADPMATCGSLVALAGYLTVRKSPTVLAWTVAWTGALIAALSKESWIALPLSLALVEVIWPGVPGRRVPERKACVRVGAFVAFGLIYIVFRQSVLGNIGGYGLDLTVDTVRRTYDATLRLVLLPFAEVEGSELINALSLLGAITILWALLGFPRLLLFGMGWLVLMPLPLLTLCPRLHDGGRLVYIVVVGWALFLGGTFDALVRSARTAGMQRLVGATAAVVLAVPLVVAQQQNCGDWRRSFRANKRLVREMVETANRHPRAVRIAVLDWPPRFDAAQSNRHETAARALAMLSDIDKERIEARLSPDAPPGTITFAVDPSLRLHTGQVEGVERWVWSGSRLQEWRSRGNVRFEHERSTGARDYVFDDREAALLSPHLRGQTGYYSVLVRYWPIRRGRGFVMWRGPDDTQFEAGRMAMLTIQPRLGDDANMANPGWLSALGDMLFFPVVDGGTVTVRSIEIARFDILPR